MSIRELLPQVSFAESSGGFLLDAARTAALRERPEAEKPEAQAPQSV
jgi:hypothetical protein